MMEGSISQLLNLSTLQLHTIPILTDIPMLALVFLFAVVASLSYIPGLGPYVSLFHTLIHETGHATMARLTGGRVRSISLFSNTEGVAQTSHTSWVGQVLTALAGYPFASLLSVLFIYALSAGFSAHAAAVLALLLLANLFLWVRNLIGWLWVLSVIGLLLVFYVYANPFYFELTLTVLSLILLIQAWVSAWVIFSLSVKRKQRAGDATILAEYTRVPAVLWGSFFFIQASFFFLIGTALFFGVEVAWMVDQLRNWGDG